MRWEVRPWHTSSGGVGGIVIFAEEITARIVAERALRPSEERFRTLFESMDEGYCVIEVIFDERDAPIDYRFLEINPAFEKQTGIKDAKGRLMRDIAPDHEQHWFDLYGRIAKTGETLRFENPAAALGRWYDVCAFRVGPPEARHVGIVFNDITQRRQTQEALRNREERLRLAQAVARIGTFEWNIQTGVNTWTPELERMYGLQPGEFTGTQAAWEQLVHPDDRADAVRQVGQAMDHGSFEAEWRVVWPDGSVHWLAGRAWVFKDEAGRPLRLVGVNIDITQRKNAEDRLREQDRRKDEFLATLAHELRNPLAPVRNSLEVMKRAEGNGELMRQARSTMERQVGHMVKLIDDLLEVSRISRGKLELKTERVELASVIYQAVVQARPLAERAGLDLAGTTPAESVYLNGDPVRLAQVFANLLNNACKFTEAGGRIRLSAERQGSDVVVSVRDTGLGIPPDKLTSIFEMFTQVDRSLERTQGGLGIGLTLAKRLVEMHGGSIEARSEGVGKGSEFVVRLPVLLDSPTQPPREPAREVERTPGDARRFLVADDNRDAADSLALLLRLAGHEVHTACDGQEAVEAAAGLRPDVILLDIGMRG